MCASRLKNLVEKPDFKSTWRSGAIMNPDVVRWLLLLGQLGKPDALKIKR